MFNESLYLYFTASYLIAEIKAQFTVFGVVGITWYNYFHLVTVCVAVGVVDWLVGGWKTNNQMEI